MIPALCLLSGVLIGVLIGWLLRSSKRTPPDTRVENELRQQRAAQDTELSRLRIELTQSNSAHATADASKLAAENSLAEQRQLLQQGAALAARLQQELLVLQRRDGELDAEITFSKSASRPSASKSRTFRKSSVKISRPYRTNYWWTIPAASISNLPRAWKNCLCPSRKPWAKSRPASTQRARKPPRTARCSKSKSAASAPRRRIFSKALKGDVKALGDWGENMLEQILDKSGLERGLHYRCQQAVKDAEGDQRMLDVIVELPEKRHLVIDSKVSLRSYEDAVNCADDAMRTLCLDRHVEALCSHFRGVGAKRYQDSHGINTPDFVLMYVPIEAAFFAAIAHKPGLFAEALEYNVVLITKFDVAGHAAHRRTAWRLADQQKHVLEIADRGGKLYDKFVGFVEDLQQVGKALENGQAAWEAASNKLHTGAGNLVRQAEQLKTLGAKAVKSLPPLLVEKAIDADKASPQLEAGAQTSTSA